MPDSNRTDDRTFEDIERRAAEITEAEFGAIRTLAHCIRELAIALPEGSMLVYELARQANRIDVYIRNSGRDAVVHGSLVVGVDSLLRDFAERQGTDR